VTEPQLAFLRASVAGAPEVEFCVDLETDDPYTSWFMSHDWIDEPVQRAFLGLVRPGARVLDLGCHLGTFSLAAAALGAEVIAVDASPAHVQLVGRAAERNGFDRLQVVHGAITESVHPVDFVERTIHGHLWVEGDPIESTVVVPPVVVDDLLEERGWETVDVVKLDIEGAEPAALRGMSRLFARGARPALVFECNESMLPHFGASVVSLREQVAELGYELLLVDHLRPGTLVEATAGAVQTECACDYLALASRPPELADAWAIEPPFGLEQTVARVLDHAASDAAGYRRYGAEVLVDGPDWLRGHPLADPAIRALRLDLDPAVRAVFDPAQPPSTAIEYAEAALPGEGGRPADVAVYAENVSVRRPTGELELASGPTPAEILLRHVSFHVRRGELLGIVTDDLAAGNALLRVLAGFDPPAAGRLEVDGASVLVAGVGAVVEPSFTIGENLALMAAYFGAHVGDTTRRLAELADHARLADELHVPLREVSAATVLRLVVATTLECVSAPLLLVGDLPAPDDESFAGWARSRAAERRHEGVAMVQLGAGDAWPLGPPHRVVWVENGDVVACGHGESMLDALRARRLGLVGVR
jgi:FkbM family methyltransferase